MALAAPGVKVYKYLKQVTNLAAPAFYRGVVRFRWLNAKGKLIKAARTAHAALPAAAPPRDAATKPPPATHAGHAGSAARPSARPLESV